MGRHGPHLAAGGKWDELASPDRYVGGPPDGARVLLGFDGSKSGDSTALIGVTVEAKPHIFVAGMWEKDPNDPKWRVPRREVLATIRQAASRWDVPETAPGTTTCGRTPARSSRTTAARRAVPADRRAHGPRHAAVLRGRPGGWLHPRRRPAPGPACGQRDAETDRPRVRPHRQGVPDSPKRIDGAVTAVFTLERAVWWNDNGAADGFNIW